MIHSLTLIKGLGIKPLHKYMVVLMNCNSYMEDMNKGVTRDIRVSGLFLIKTLFDATV